MLEKSSLSLSMEFDDRSMETVMIGFNTELSTGRSCCPTGQNEAKMFVLFYNAPERGRTIG
jgi:hypothetical protein